MKGSGTYEQGPLHLSWPAKRSLPTYALPWWSGAWCFCNLPAGVVEPGVEGKKNSSNLTFGGLEFTAGFAAESWVKCTKISEPQFSMSDFMTQFA